MTEEAGKEKCTCKSSEEVAVCLKDCDIRFDDPPLPAHRTSNPLVQRLRTESSEQEEDYVALCDEAADEIERLQREIERLKDVGVWRGLTAQVEAQAKKIERQAQEIAALSAAMKAANDEALRLQRQDEVHWKTRRSLVAERDRLRALLSERRWLQEHK